MNEAEARVRAALAAGGEPARDDVAEVVAELDRERVESAARWEAIGRLAPAAKAHRERAEDAVRLLAAIGDALRAGSIDLASREDWARRIGVMLGVHG